MHLAAGRPEEAETVALTVYDLYRRTRNLNADTILTGVLCGLAAVAFHLAIRAAEGVLIDRALSMAAPTWMLWTILLPTVGGVISGALLSYVVPDARGSGIPQVKVAYAVKGGRMPFSVALGKFALGVIQIGSGASLGREGPTVQMGAGITRANELRRRGEAVPPRPHPLMPQKRMRNLRAFDRVVPFVLESDEGLVIADKLSDA